jgi:uncharacterized membrane protein
MSENNLSVRRLLHTKLGLLVSSIALFGLAYLVFLRASDTGSLQQYFIMFVVIFLGFNRLVRLARVARYGQTKTS